MGFRIVAPATRGLKYCALLSSVAACAAEPAPIEVSEQPPVAVQSPPPFVAPTETVFEEGPGLSSAPEQLPGGRACVGSQAGAEILPAVMQLVVDTSGSMNQTPPGATRSKWEQTRAALLDSIDLLPDNTAVGLVFYPDQVTEAGDCFDGAEDAPIEALGPLGSGARQLVEGRFVNQSPQGGTPTHDAYNFSLAQLQSVQLPGRKFVVLITDGQPTFSEGCRGTGLISDPVDPTPLIRQATDALAGNVRTFVVGSPGSEEARDSLSAMAQAGGTAPLGCRNDGPDFCHFDMTQERDLAVALRAAFEQIAGQVLSCAVDIPAPPGDGQLVAGQVNVLFTPAGGDEVEIIGRSTEDNCEEGWQYSEDGSQVLLCGATCDRLRDADGDLSLEFGCETIVY